MPSVLILGGGPAGLAAAYALCQEGYQVTVLEEAQQVGGISKTVVEGGYRFDLGGHRFFTKIPQVEQVWHQVLGEDFLVRPRLSRIYYRGKFFDYPLKPLNALQTMGIGESVLIVASYLKAKIFPVRPEESLEDWVANRFGRRLYRHFFKSYTEKVWGIPCTELKAEWAAQRIKGLNLVTALFNALLGGRGQKQIKSLIEEFHYPRLGPGMMYEAMAQRIGAMGGRVLTRHRVIQLDCSGKRVDSVVVTTPAGEEMVLTADYIISSLPLRNLFAMLPPADLETGQAAEEVQAIETAKAAEAAPAVKAAQAAQAAASLKYRDFLTVNLAINRPELFPDNWIYVHSPEVRLGRIQNFRRWSPAMVPEEGCSSLGLEYFCNQGDDLWQMADPELIQLAVGEICSLGLLQAEWVKWGTVVRVPKAYPVYDDDYQAALPLIRSFLSGWDNFQTIGRNGLHRYNNMDHSILTGLLAARNIQGGTFDLWTVNTDEEYHEEK